MRMQWDRLLCDDLLGADKQPEKDPSRDVFHQDADRILFSAPFRRLANKTQVHPLYEVDHIHHRLIHSAETASVGRSLGMKLGAGLLEREIEGVGADAPHRLSYVLQAACLAHDIGNPPFGHSGEESIGKWFCRVLDAGHGLFSQMSAEEQVELRRFEGNAQGFRILTRTEMYRNEGGMRLSLATLGSFSKYTCSEPAARAWKAAGNAPYVSFKKPGFYLSEAGYFGTVAQGVGMIEVAGGAAPMWRRHPLAFLVEAADDICYNIVDVEDAFASGDVSYEEAVKLLGPLAGNKTVKDSQSKEEQVSYLRAIAIGRAIDSCMAAFWDNYDAIMVGRYNGALSEDGPLGPLFNAIRAFCVERVFTSARKTKLEILGERAIGNVLDAFSELYVGLERCDWDLDRLQAEDDSARKLIRASGIDMRDARDPYSAARSLCDFVSGMTDRYALQMSDLVLGIR
ncbi:deoxyguanosinetriphosphate triphosphohydrolase [Pelagimonas sp. KU-00592-HH]|uniref:dGTP triphosphohydrolase n=1 Tax=Pelagimonas sp. KU-00592-HH TaxID=3127651 RepID=UPI003105508C